MAQQLGEQRTWSASQFNDFGYCAFRFFAKRLLRLSEVEEPSEGLDAAQLGSLQHAILEETYSIFRDRKTILSPENVEFAIETMHAQADTIFATAPKDFGFRQTPLWEQEQAEIRRRLEALISLDFSNEKDNPFIGTSRTKNAVVKAVGPNAERTVFALESEFGNDTAPMALHGTAGWVKARGFIDRIDRVGNKLIVVDYKSGTQMPSAKDIESGRNFQMMLYLAAAEHVVAPQYNDLHVAAGLFWSIRSRKAAGQVAPDQAEIENARQYLDSYILAARAGKFDVDPPKTENGRCFRHCEFYQLCRVQRTKAYHKE